MRPPRSIVITGGSSGIGAAIAREYAAPGVALAVLGRDPDRLDAVASDCRARGADAIAERMDVTDAAEIARWLTARDAQHEIDLIVANAGISGGTLGGGESDEQARRIFAVNVDGVLNTILPVVPGMRARGRGQIAIMSSLAGFLGFPGAPAYSASKAAVRIYGEALRGHLHRQGICVSVICPGFIESPMTAANDFRMPFLMSAEKAARIIRRGLARDRPRIAFPWPMYMLVRLSVVLPVGIIDRATRRLPEKG